MRNSTASGPVTRDVNTRIPLRTTAFAAADYAVNALILFGFAAAGTIPYSVPLQLLVVIVIFNAIFLGGIASGFTQRFRDPSITGLQVFAACGINLLGLLMAPQIAYMFVVNLFVPLSFGSLHFTQRAFLFSWFFLSCALGLTLRFVGGQVDIAVATGAERWLFWAVVVIALGRFTAINAEVSRLRARLQERNKDLASMTMKLAELASRDDLTGLWNRREFMRLLTGERRRAERNTSGFCVAIVDVDHFKEVNDRFGHFAGDAVLQELAKVLENTRRATDTLARYGGEEFTLLLLDAKTDAAAVALERVRVAVEQHDWARIAPGLRVTVSAGVAAWRPGENIGLVINRADKALYEAKSAGRNCVRVESGSQ